MNKDINRREQIIFKQDYDKNNSDKFNQAYKELHQKYQDMYLDVDRYGRYSLSNMKEEDLKSLQSMIEGSGLEERRRFHTILLELRKRLQT